MPRLNVAGPASDGTLTATVTGPQVTPALPHVLAGVLVGIIDGQLIDQGYWRTSPWERAGRKEIRARVIDVGVEACRVAEEWLIGPLPHQEASET